jgi:hypothetical protein
MLCGVTGIDRIFHKDPKERIEGFGSGEPGDEAEPLFSQTPAYSKMLSHLCGSMVVLHHVDKHLVCSKAAGALTTIPTCHSQ